VVANRAVGSGAAGCDVWREGGTVTLTGAVVGNQPRQLRTPGTVDLVAAHPPSRDSSVHGAGEHRRDQDWLGGELDLVRHTRHQPPGWVVGPAAGQVEPTRARPERRRRGEPAPRRCARPSSDRRIHQQSARRRARRDAARRTHAGPRRPRRVPPGAVQQVLHPSGLDSPTCSAMRQQLLRGSSASIPAGTGEALPGSPPRGNRPATRARS
jgi:hypothetical protein